MSNFSPPPTYAEVILTDKEGRHPRFNPIWLKWFVDLTANVTDGGAGSGSVTGVTATSPLASSGGVAPDISFTGTLAVSKGGTGITSFGSGIATWLGTPSSANLAAALTDEEGTGAATFTVAWTDYSATSTVSGWSSFTNKEIYYKRIGKTVLCAFRIAGTSNSTAADFTLPYTSAAAPVGWAGISGTQIDNGVTQTAPGRCVILASSASVATYWDWALSPWTSSGTKQTVGTLWYEAV